MGNPEYTYEEDVDLRECINIISKRKKMILNIFFIIVIATTIVTFLVPKTYEVKAVIQRGYFNSSILSYQETSALLRSRDFFNPIFEKVGIKSSYEKDDIIENRILLEDVKKTDIFILKVRLNNNDLGYSLIQEITNAYVEYGNSIYFARNDVTKNYLSQIDGLIEKTEMSVNEKALSKKKSVIPLAFPDDKVQIRDLFSTKFQLETQLIANKEFKLMDRLVKPKYPIAPKKGLIIISSIVFSLFAGLLYAFIAESWGKGKIE